MLTEGRGVGSLGNWGYRWFLVSQHGYWEPNGSYWMSILRIALESLHVQEHACRQHFYVKPIPLPGLLG